MWYAGCGFCSQRPDKGGGAHIKSWTSDNPATNYVIENNLMVDTADMLVHISAKKEGPNGGDSMPRLENNHFAGKKGSSFGILAFHSLTPQPYTPDIAAYLGEKSNGDTLWFIEEDR